MMSIAHRGMMMTMMDSHTIQTTENLNSTHLLSRNTIRQGLELISGHLLGNTVPGR